MSLTPLPGNFFDGVTEQEGSGGSAAGLEQPLANGFRTASEGASRPRRGSVQEGKSATLGRGGTICGSILNLVNSMVGIGILALPSAISRVGFLAGAVLLVLCSFAARSRS